ncbi:HSF-type DNA-binding-domain-containing protein [Mycena galericulata]|nr:HSF-type DNA-binding-domain-containing protein [Mycena galericulata]
MDERMDCKSNIGRMSSATEFIKKLYKILNDQALQHVVGWTPQRDCFVVKDIEEFRKSVLPTMFKHSNFASFVRQLNKYGFHKVKTFDDGKNVWMFQHPDFQADHRDELDKIQRKMPRPQKSTPKSTTSTLPESLNAEIEYLQTEVASMQAQLGSFGTVVGEILSHVRFLEHSYKYQQVEMVALQRGISQQDKLLEGLTQYLLRVNDPNGGVQGGYSCGPASDTFSLGQAQELHEALPSGSNLDDRSVGAAGINADTLARIEDSQVPRYVPSTTVSLERDPMVSQQQMASPDWGEFEELPAPKLDVLPTSSQVRRVVSATGVEGSMNWPVDSNVYYRNTRYGHVSYNPVEYTYK